MKLFDATLSTLERSLDVRLAPHAVQAGNVANADTPGFTPSDLDFQAAMTAASPEPAAPTRAGDLPLVAAASAAPERFVAADPGAAPGLDGNSVDLDRTLGAIAENAIQYGAAAKAAAKKLAILRYVASDGAA
jgi:flagellar basal-body rod protein FlgB